VVAVATHLSAGGVGPAREVPERLIAEIGPGAGDLVPLIRRAANSVEAGQPTEAFAVDLGLGRGVSGFVIHTVPVVLHAWLRFPEDYASPVRSGIRCGGDQDPTPAIVGGIVARRLPAQPTPDPRPPHPPH